MSDKKKFDVVVIGAGPGGYVSAVRASQLGLKTAIVEKTKTLGGTCLNVGCIPSKALLDSSEQFQMAQHKFGDHGIEFQSLKFDLKKMMKRKDVVVSEVCDGVEYLMKKNKIERFHGSATIVSKNEVEVSLNNKKKEKLEASNIIIATGSVPIEIKGMEYNSKTIISSNEAIALNKVPKHLIIIGSGVIGLELGSVWSRLGAKVTVLEMLPGIMTDIDRQTGSLAQRTLAAQGLKFMFDVKVTGAKVKGNKVLVSIEDKKAQESEISGDILLVAVGRKAFTAGLGLENVGIQMDGGRIAVNEKYQTSTANIYAIGDVIKGPMLAHKAEDEGIAVAENIVGQSGHVNYNAIPYIIYTWPEIAWVGHGEEELKKAKIPYNVGRAIFRSNGRAKAMAESEGQVKILAHKETDKLLGVFILGPRASDMIAEAAVAVEFGASAEDIARSVHAHPTLSEVLREAAMACGKWSIHS